MIRVSPLAVVLAAISSSLALISCAATTGPGKRGEAAVVGPSAAPQAPTVVRRAPVDVKALLNTAPTTAGVAAASRDPVFAAAAAADLVVVADPQLDRLARGVLLMALDGKSPSALLVTDMGERLGVGGGVSASFAIGPGLTTTTTSEFTRIATELGTGTRVRVGVAREIRDGQTFTFVAVTPTPLAIDTLERKRAPGETVTLTGNWHAPDRPLTFFADDGSGGVVSGDVDVGDEGAVTVSHTLPTTPGIVRLEFVSADDNDIEHNVYELTFYVGDVPALVERVGEDTLDTARVITTINRLRGDRPYEVSPLLAEALLQPDRAAVQAHFARSKFLVRHQGQQTFTGVFSAAEFEAMALQSPSVRFRLASENTNAMGAVLEAHGSEGKTVRVFTAEVRDTIHVPTEQRRALDGINRARLRAKQKALVKDDAVEAALQAHVMKMCRGEATVSDQTALQVALDPVLRMRGYSSIATFLATGDDIPSTLWARNFAEVKRAEFNVAAVGACNGAHAVVGVRNAVAVVVVLGSR